MSRAAGKLSLTVRYQHENKRTRRVTDFQFVATGNKLWTVPQAGCRLDGQSVDDSGDGKHEPRHTGVDFLECCLLHNASLDFFGEGSNK